MAAQGVLTRPPQLDRFLHAIIETERNGMGLNVLSLLARAGHDPWTEAARLAGLPRSAAADSLAATIACLPAGSHLRTHARMLALCLVMLLPDQTHSVPGSLAAGTRRNGRMRVTLLTGATLGAALALGLLVGAAAWATSHAGLADAPDASRPSPVEQASWPSPGGP